MEARSLLVRVLVVLGTAAVWLPVALMLITGAIGSSRAGVLRMDYLMPAELFLLVLAGGALLSYGAGQARARRLLVQGAFAVAVLALVLSQVVAATTGLASGAAPAEGLPWAAVVTLIVVYDLAAVALGVGGVLLLRDLARQRRKTVAPR